MNHIPWSTWAGLNQPSIDQLIDWKVDFVDITTGERLDLQTIYYARSRGLPIVAGTDAHHCMLFLCIIVILLYIKFFILYLCLFFLIYFILKYLIYLLN